MDRIHILLFLTDKINYLGRNLYLKIDSKYDNKIVVNVLEKVFINEELKIDHLFDICEEKNIYRMYPGVGYISLCEHNRSYFETTDKANKIIKRIRVYLDLLKYNQNIEHVYEPYNIEKVFIANRLM
jgi:hypothetical protein